MFISFYPHLMRTKLFFISVFTLICSVAIGQSKLSYSLAVGDEFKVYQNTSQDILQDMNGQQHNITSNIDGEFTFIVNKVSSEFIEFTFKFDRLTMLSKSNLAGELMAVDTSKEAEETDIMGRMLSQLIGIDLQMTMYKNGKVKEIKGAEAIIDKMVGILPNLDELSKAQIKASMASDFSSESLANSFEQMTYIYPSDNNVAVGDTWTNGFKGELSSENIWTLNEVTDSNANIQGEGDVTFITEDDSISMNLKGTMTSEIMTDLETGFIKNMSVESVAKGNSELKQMSGTEIPTTVTTITSYKIDHVQ